MSRQKIKAIVTQPKIISNISCNKINAIIDYDNVKAILQRPQNIQVKLTFAVNITEDIDIYDGPYEVIPKFAPQELDTDFKLMKDDLTVLEIQVTEVSNPQGGYTLSI